MPPVPAAGVPLNTPVEELKVSPVGNVPDSLRVSARESAGRHRKAAGTPDRERGAVGAGDRRSLIDGEREALAGLLCRRRWMAVKVRAYRCRRSLPRACRSARPWRN